MKSMNFILSPGALIFLLLGVGSTLGQFSGTAGLDETCEFGVLDPAKTCHYNDGVGLKCYKDGVEVDKGVTGGKCACRTAPEAGFQYVWNKKSGKCTHIYFDQTIAYGLPCKGLKSCKDGAACRSGGSKGEPGKPDNQGTHAYEIGDEDGKCVCPINKVYNEEKKECLTKVSDPTVPGTGSASSKKPKPSKDSSGSDRLACQSNLLLLTMAAIGSLLLL